MITDFGEFESGSDGGLLSQGAFSLGGIGVDLFVKIDEFGMSPAESVQFGSQSPVIEFGGSIVTILGLVGPLFFISLAPSFLINPSWPPSF